jgi:hypothetical protein
VQKWDILIQELILHVLTIFYRHLFLKEDSFKGIYNNYVKYHENDLKEVLDRSHNAGVDKMIIKGIFVMNYCFIII